MTGRTHRNNQGQIISNEVFSKCIISLVVSKLLCREFVIINLPLLYWKLFIIHNDEWPFPINITQAHEPKIP